MILLVSRYLITRQLISRSNYPWILSNSEVGKISSQSSANTSQSLDFIPKAIYWKYVEVCWKYSFLAYSVSLFFSIGDENLQGIKRHLTSTKQRINRKWIFPTNFGWVWIRLPNREAQMFLVFSLEWLKTVSRILRYSPAPYQETSVHFLHSNIVLYRVFRVLTPPPLFRSHRGYTFSHFPLELDAHIHTFCSPDEYFNICEYGRLTPTGNG